MAIRLWSLTVDDEQRRAEAIAGSAFDTQLPFEVFQQDPSGHVERITRELAALLQTEEVSVRVDRRRIDSSSWQKTITIRVPARHWEGLLTELDAVAAMLPDSAAGATVVIEDDTPPTIYDAISIGGSWSNIANKPPLTRETLRAAFLELAEGDSLAEVAEYAYDVPRDGGTNGDPTG